MMLKRFLTMTVRLPTALLAVLIAGAGGAVLAQTASPGIGYRTMIEQVVREYLLAHPELITEAMSRLQNREVKSLLDANRQAIEAPFAGAIAGNPKGDVAVVVFFDYACPYCRQAHADALKLIKADPQVKIVYRDFPVLSEASDEAAMASLSAATQGRYGAFHNAMFEQPGQVSHERTIAMVRRAGLDEVRTAKDLASPALKAEIRRNVELGRTLGLTGTPSYVIGNRILSGAVGADVLAAAVAEARKAAAETRTAG